MAACDPVAGNISSPIFHPKPAEFQDIEDACSRSLDIETLQPEMTIAVILEPKKIHSEKGPSLGREPSACCILKHLISETIVDLRHDHRMSNKATPGALPMLLVSITK